jgi:hypothetical protein
MTVIPTEKLRVHAASWPDVAQDRDPVTSSPTDVISIEVHGCRFGRSRRGRHDGPSQYRLTVTTTILPMHGRDPDFDASGPSSAWSCRTGFEIRLEPKSLRVGRADRVNAPRGAESLGCGTHDEVGTRALSGFAQSGGPKRGANRFFRRNMFYFISLWKSRERAKSRRDPSRRVPDMLLHRVPGPSPDICVVDTPEGPGRFSARCRFSAGSL